VIPLPRAVAVTRMLILDVGGRRRRSLALGDLPAGEWRFTWNAAAESGGRVVLLNESR
jgi:hypothetical protein